MAFSNTEKFHVFEQAISSTLNELGLVSLKKEQRQAVEAIVMNCRDVFGVLPTGFEKSLIYQVLPGSFRFHIGRFL